MSQQSVSHETQPFTAPPLLEGWRLLPPLLPRPSLQHDQHQPTSVYSYNGRPRDDQGQPPLLLPQGGYRACTLGNDHIASTFALCVHLCMCVCVSICQFSNLFSLLHLPTENFGAPPSGEQDLNKRERHGQGLLTLSLEHGPCPSNLFTRAPHPPSSSRQGPCPSNPPLRHGPTPPAPPHMGPTCGTPPPPH